MENQRIVSDINVMSSMKMKKAVVESLGFHHKYRFECRDKFNRLKFIDDFVNSIPIVGLNKYLDATLKSGLTSPLWYIGLMGPLASDGAMSLNSAVLTSASNPFTSAMQGKAIIVKGAGAAGADLVTMITTFTSAGSVTLAAQAATAVTNAVFAVEGLSADTMSSHAFIEVTNYSSGTRLQWSPGTVSGGSVDNSASAATFVFSSAANVTGAFLVDNNTKAGSSGTLLGVGLNSPIRQVQTSDSLVVTVQLVAVSM